MHAFIPQDNNISLRTQIIYGSQDQLKLNKTNKELRNLSKKRKALPDEGISLNIKPPISGASRSISHRVRVIVHSSQPKTICSCCDYWRATPLRCRGRKAPEV